MMSDYKKSSEAKNRAIERELLAGRIRWKDLSTLSYTVQRDSSNRSDDTYTVKRDRNYLCAGEAESTYLLSYLLSRESKEAH